MRHPSQNYVNSVPWISFLNQSGQQIPGFGCVTPNYAGGSSLQSNGSDSNVPAVLVVTQSQKTGSQVDFWLNGPMAVDPGGYGICAQPTHYPMMALISGEADPSYTCGPTSGSWALTPQIGGFQLLSSAGQQGDYQLWFVQQVPFYIGDGVAQATIPPKGSGLIEPFPAAPSNLYLKIVNSTGSTVNYGDEVIYAWTGEQYEIIVGSGPSKIIKGILSGPLAKNGNATVYDDLLNKYKVFEVLGNIGGQLSIASNIQFYYNQASLQYECITPLPQVVRAVLTSALAQGGTATATTDDGQYITVTECLGGLSSSLTSGTNIIVFWNTWKAVWGVISAACPASTSSGPGGVRYTVPGDTIGGTRGGTTGPIGP